MKRACLHDRAPEMVLDDQHFGFGVREKLQVLLSAELVVEGNKYAAAIEDCVCRDQPLGLIRS